MKWSVWQRRPPPPLPTVEYKGADVTVSTEPEADIKTGEPPVDRGEEHSRLWIYFLSGAITLLEEEIRAGIGDVDDKQRQILDKQREITIHTARYPDRSRDLTYIQRHLQRQGQV